MTLSRSRSLAEVYQTSFAAAHMYPQHVCKISSHSVESIFLNCRKIKVKSKLRSLSDLGQNVCLRNDLYDPQILILEKFGGH